MWVKQCQTHLYQREPRVGAELGRLDEGVVVVLLGLLRHRPEERRRDGRLEVAEHARHRLEQEVQLVVQPGHLRAGRDCTLIANSLTTVMVTENLAENWSLNHG